MRVVLLRSNPVNPYPRLEKTANCLLKNGYSVHVLAWDRSSKYNEKLTKLELSNGDVPITRFGIPSSYGAGIKKNLFPLIKFQFELLKWLIKNRTSYDVIHAYDFDTGYVSLVIARLFRKKIVYDIADYYVDSHNLKNTALGSMIEKKEHNIINKADAVIICTEERKNQIKGTHPKKLVIIHNAPKKSTSYTKHQKTFEINRSEKIKIVYVGILDESRLLKEMADVIKSKNNCELHIAGFGQLEKYFINLANDNNRINYYGKVLYTDTLYMENQCDIITAIYDPSIPNHKYAAPNKFYEALMLGKPLIMVQNTGMDKYVSEYDLGEVIEYSKEGFEKGLNRLINRKEEWDDISKKSKALYNKEFSWEEMERRIINLYQYIGNGDYK